MAKQDWPRRIDFKKSRDPRRGKGRFKLFEVFGAFPHDVHPGPTAGRER